MDGTFVKKNKKKKTKQRKAESLTKQSIIHKGSWRVNTLTYIKKKSQEHRSANACNKKIKRPFSNNSKIVFFFTSCIKGSLSTGGENKKKKSSTGASKPFYLLQHSLGALNS